jgi:hypothetical protein
VGKLILTMIQLCGDDGHCIFWTRMMNADDLGRPARPPFQLIEKEKPTTASAAYFVVI